MNKIKKIAVLVLSVVMLMMNVLSVWAERMPDEMLWNNGNARSYATSVYLYMNFVGDELYMTCTVDAPVSTTSISMLYVLREENAAGNLVIADTWSDSGTGDSFEEEYSYSPVIEGKEYELSVRVGIYDKNGLVGYDYYTISAVN